ncbi:MAG: response regulator [Planctomycetes bacterium]|nr:response regulator [Planctomycetota bacterium]
MRPIVLMVDDNLGDHQLLTLAFDEAGIAVEVRFATDGYEGQKLLRAMTDGREPLCRLVLLDLNMPRINGRELLGWARTLPALRDVPIVVLTSSQIRKDRDDCLAGGATAFQIKPFDFNEYVTFARSLSTFLAG